MLKQVILVVAFLVLGCQVKSEDTDQEVQLICPDGWVAHQLHFFNCTNGKTGWIKNCSTCLTCQRNSVLYHPFRNVDFCVVLQPDVITPSNYYVQLEKCTDNICNELYYQPFCGMALTMSNHRITSKKVLRCQNIQPVTQNNTLESVDLICPTSSSFKSLVERKILLHQNNNWTNIISYCIACNHNAENDLSRNQMITMCSPHFYPKGKNIYQVENKEISECQDTDTSKCAPDTIPPIQKGLHCGSKFTASRYQNSINISKYIPCDHGRNDQTKVK
jgi:hypothetical protein